MRCMICGMEYPPKGWDYYSVRVVGRPEFIICSDCVAHLRLVKEDADGNIIGYGVGVKQACDTYKDEGEK